MKIIINGKDAVLKKGTSFEFVAENRSFTGSDSYTLSITFPLRGCPENIAIFGYINRTDIDKSKVVFDCEISDINFHSAGTITNAGDFCFIVKCICEEFRSHKLVKRHNVRNDISVNK